MVAGKSPEWLPPGFTEKVKYKNGRKIKYYYNVATGTKYHSKKDVTSCAAANDGLLGTPQTTKGDDNRVLSNNEVDAAILVKTNDSPDWLPNGWKMEEKTRQSGLRQGSVYKVYTELSSGSKFYSRAAVSRYIKSADHAHKEIVQNKPQNVDEPVPNVSPQCISMTKMSNDIPGKKKGNSFKAVAVGSTAADDLPPGWIKEIKTSKSGNRIRKDPFYTDPVSGYVFRSKLDALRYLKTNDIASCACRPKKRELDDAKSIANEIPSSSPANEKLSEHKGQLFPDGELNGGSESSGEKSQVKSAAKVSKQTQDNDESDSVKVTSNGVEEKISHENSNKNAEMEIPEPATEVSKKDPSESGMKKSTDKTPSDSRKSKKRRDLSVPSRTSKRLAGGEPETESNSNLSERSLRAAARRSSGIKVDTSSSFTPEALATTTQPSEIEPPKEDANRETLQVIEPPKQEPPNQVENNPPAIPEEKVIEQKVVEKQPDDTKTSQESQLCYDFGDSWSDPLEFALKTLRGEIPIDDPLAFSGGFDEQLSIPYNQTLGPSQSDAPIIFHNEFVPSSESSKQKGPVNQFAPNSSSFSAPGNLWNGFNSQPSADAGKKDCPTKFNP